MKRSLDQFADDAAQARYRESQNISRRNRVLTAELKEATEKLAKAEKLIGLYEAVDAIGVEPPAWKVPKADAKHHGIPCLQLSDIHWGAVIKPEEINFINAYNLHIAHLRLKRTFEGTIKLARDYFAGLTYDGCQVFLPGDMHSGSIHDELAQTNEVTMADSIVSLAEPLVAGITMLAEEFGKVRIACVVGNHGRTTKKPRAKLRATDSYDYLTYRILARDFAKDPRVQVTVSKSADLAVQIHNTRYMLTHGDQFKGGTGISAELAPLLLGVHRKLRRDAAAGTPWDIMVMGHFHKTLMLPHNGLIVGGSTMGYDEYAFHQNFKPEPPMSAFWVNTPERGVTFMAPVHAMKRGEEGW
jgi:predicted phosphodiesterase